MSWSGLFHKFWHKLWHGDKPTAERPAPSRADLSTASFPDLSALTLESGGLTLRVGVLSTVGNVREHNEDNYYVPGRGSLRNGPISNHERHLPTVDYPSKHVPGLFVVADGMGGQLAGEKASQMAVDLIPTELDRRLGTETEDRATQRAVREAVARANEEILALSHLGTEYANMGTTVVLALFRRDRAFIAGIGDSRAYRLRGSKLEQLTRDHSLANALGEAGTIRPEEVETHKFKHVLYLYLGSKDARDGPEEVRVVDIQPGDQFLLATDGLMGVVRDEQIAEILIKTADPQKAAQVLVAQSLENKSKDNITCVVIHVDKNEQSG